MRGIKVGGHFKLMMMSEVERKRRIERRKATLFKQAKELSVLCGVEVGMIMLSPGEEGPIVWPSLEEATTRFLEFWGLPEGERKKRMVTQEKVLRDWVNGEIEKLWKKEEDVEKEEMNVLMKQVILGNSMRLEEMDARQVLGLYVLAGEKMQELEKRKQDLLQLHNHGGVAEADGGSYYVPQPPVPLFDAWWKTAPPATATPAMEATATPAMAVPQPPVPLFDAWWKTAAGSVPPPATATPAMAAPPALDGGGEGSHHQMIFSAAAAGGSSSTNNGGGNYAAASSSSNYGDHQLPDLTQAWPYNFSSSF